jgi:hypothetical protein
MRRTFEREFYIPKESKLVPSDLCTPEECSIYFSDYGHCWRATVFIGKQSKPAKDYTFRDQQKALDYIATVYKNVSDNLAANKVAKKARVERKRADKQNFQGVVGSIFVSSWGYEQTNVEAYQITARINNQEIEAVKIGLDQVADTNNNSMADTVKPRPVTPEVAETMPKIRMRITGVKSIKPVGAHGFRNADMWDGKESYYRSWYG